ncbi:MAG: ABC transporter permease [Chitinophagaceae bacterium]
MVPVGGVENICSTLSHFYSLFLMTSHPKSSSFAHQTWRRLCRNRSALIGMGIIGVAVFVGLFAYLLAPDSTPDSNLMTLEIGGKPPGFHHLFLVTADGVQKKQVGLLSKILYGQPENLQWLPINGYHFEGRHIVVQAYVDQGISDTQTLDIRKISIDPLPGASLADLRASLIRHQLVSRTFWLGTDKYGRDLLSRLMVGVRVSLAVGLISVIISLSIGIFLGALGGYFGGWVDGVVMWLINVVWAIPTLLLVFAITLALGKGFWQIFLAVGLTMWVNVARIIRGQVLSLREVEFIEAARALGYGHFRIIFRHILPNILGPVIVVAANNFASAIIVEAGLSFLGIGVQPPTPSWGLMIRENYGFIITHHPMLAIIPGLAIMLLVLAFNLLGNGLRDAMDVRL